MITVMSVIWAFSIMFCAQRYLDPKREDRSHLKDWSFWCFLLLVNIATAAASRFLLTLWGFQ